MALALLPGLAAAQTDEDELILAYGDQRTVSVAAGSRQPLRQAPAVASVITAEAIQAMGAVDLASQARDLLAKLPPSSR